MRLRGGVLGLRLIVGSSLVWLACCAVAPAPEPGMSGLLTEARTSPARAVDAMRAICEKIAGRPFVPGNHVRLLINGPASFAALAAAIGSARQRIDMESYEFDDDAGVAFGNALLAAKHRGLAVHLIYDGWGTLTTPSALFDELRRGGIATVDYNPLVPGVRLPFDINSRDHRKLFVTDNRVVITGGVNISGVYVNPPGIHAADPDDEAWRDTDIRIEGPVAAEFEQIFAGTWQRQSGHALPAPPQPPPPFADGVPVLAIDGAPAADHPRIYRALLATIALARKSVHLTTGFFAPTGSFLRALEAAARRGVDVQIIVPARSTSSAALAAGRADYGQLLTAGVGIHEFHGRILHAKTAVIDGVWSAIGSSNLDWRSTVWNNELDAVVLSRQFGADMETVFTEDLADTTEISRHAWAERGLGERLDEFGAGLIAPLL